MRAKKVKIVKHIVAKGYPLDAEYSAAHSQADSAEKRTYPQRYRELEKIVKKTKPNELLATHDRQGHIRIESKVPRRYRKDIILHEEVERKADVRLRNKRK